MAANRRYRRYAEIIVTLAFVGLGLLVVFGKLPLPKPPANVADLLPRGTFSADEAAYRAFLCETCLLDCPLAGSKPNDQGARASANPVPIDEAPVIPDHAAQAVADLDDFPLPGAYVRRSGEEFTDGGRRIWLELVTCSPAEEVVEWYRTHAPAAGWALVHDADGFVPNATFLVFEHHAQIINVLIEVAGETSTRIVLDYPGR